MIWCESVTAVPKSIPPPSVICKHMSSMIIRSPVSPGVIHFGLKWRRRDSGTLAVGELAVTDVGKSTHFPVRVPGTITHLLVLCACYISQSLIQPITHKLGQSVPHANAKAGFSFCFDFVPQIWRCMCTNFFGSVFYADWFKLREFEIFMCTVYVNTSDAEY